MSDLPHIESSIEKAPPSQKKKIAIITGVVIAVLIIVILIGLVVSNSRNPNSNANTPQSQNPNQPDTATFPFLPDNMCPVSMFEENGILRADLGGNMYRISEEQKTWIQANCQNVSGMNNNDNQQQNNNQQNSNQVAITPETEPPLLLGNLGFNLGEYDAATQTAGEMKFTRTPLPFNQIIGVFGQQDPRPGNGNMKNPQPVFILPLGTKVQAIVTGEVVEVKELYSGDMTVWIAKNNQSSYFYEMEHIINPTVTVGDKVTAGQVIGEVSDFDSHNNPGFGLIEIGILFSNGPGVPKHVCPLAYLEPSVKSTIESRLTKVYAAWNAYLGQNIYNYSTFATPGCVVTDAIDS